MQIQPPPPLQGSAKASNQWRGSKDDEERSHLEFEALDREHVLALAECEPLFRITPLGVDRYHRRYWFIRSLHGIFIEPLVETISDPNAIGKDVEQTRYNKDGNGDDGTPGALVVGSVLMRSASTTALVDGVTVTEPLAVAPILDRCLPSLRNPALHLPSKSCF